MDKIEAMKLLSEIKHYLTAGNPVWDVDEIAEACDMAIEALEMQDLCAEMLESAKPVSTDGDLISRQSALDAIDKRIVKLLENPVFRSKRAHIDLYGAKKLIREIPSSEPKTGHWVEIEDYNGDIHYQCDQCGEEFILIDGTPDDNNYWHCPNCGSYNREVRKNED